MSTCLRSFSNYCVHGIFSFKRCVEILCMIVYYRKMKDSFRRSGSCGFRATSELKKHRQVTYGRCVKRKLDLQERLSVSFFFVLKRQEGGQQPRYTPQSSKNALSRPSPTSLNFSFSVTISSASIRNVIGIGVIWQRPRLLRGVKKKCSEETKAFNIVKSALGKHCGSAKQDSDGNN